MGNSPAERTGMSVEAIMTWEQATAAYQFGMPRPAEFGLGPDYDRALRGVVQEVADEHPGC